MLTSPTSADIYRFIDEPYLGSNVQDFTFLQGEETGICANQSGTSDSEIAKIVNHKIMKINLNILLIKKP